MNRRGFLSSLVAVPALLFGVIPAGAAVEPYWFRVRPKAVEPVRWLHHDIEALFAQISSHTMRTGDVITSADEPLRKLVGFRAERSDVWSIHTDDLGSSLRKMERYGRVPPAGPALGMMVPSRLKAQILRKYFSSAEGRRKLAQSFPIRPLS